MKYFFIILIFGFILSGCEMIIDVDLPEEDPKLVVQSFISPQEDEINVTVINSSPNFGKSKPNAGMNVDNATVTISDGSVTANLAYDSLWEHYYISTNSFKLAQGRTYELSVTTPDGRSVSASCTIPVKVNNSIEFVSMDSITDDFGSYLKLKFQFQDIPNEDNFYRIHVVYKYIDLFTNDTSYAKLYFYSNEQNISDKNRDGEKLNVIGELWDLDMIKTLLSFQMYLLTTDEHYYSFHKSMAKFSDMDGFFIEPTLVYSNIEGGLGVFASYNQSVVVHEL